MGLKNYFFVSRDKVTELFDMMGAGVLMSELARVITILLSDMGVIVFPRTLNSSSQILKMYLKTSFKQLFHLTRPEKILYLIGL